MTAKKTFVEIQRNLPEPWPESLLPQIQQELERYPRKIIVLDDDPTGCQTVHDVPIYTHWTREDLEQAFRDPSHVVYLLTNSRSLPSAEAAELARTLGSHLREVSAEVGQEFVVVSRSDSTLRGYFPLETDALRESLQVEFDGLLLIPFFLEGGRLTFDDTHWVRQGDTLVPASETAFAEDPAFGYSTSYLPEWVAEKTRGRVPAGEVQTITLAMLRQEGPKAVTRLLLEAEDEQVIVVNAFTYRDLEVLVLGLLNAERAGKRFLYRTAASFVPVRGGMALQPPLSSQELQQGAPEGSGGLMVVGSFVPLTTRQLDHLINDYPILSLELDVRAIVSGNAEAEVDRVTALVNRALAQGEYVVLFTSREHIGGRGEQAISTGQLISSALVEVVRHLEVEPRFVVSKGGITSSDVATRGLKVRRALVLGQALPGVPVWELGAESRFPGQRYIVFPGNVGNDQALLELVRKLDNAGDRSR